MKKSKFPALLSAQCPRIAASFPSKSVVKEYFKSSIVILRGAVQVQEREP